MKTFARIIFIFVCCFSISGCVSLTPEQQEEWRAVQNYWNQYVPNKHVAIKSLGSPDDISYANPDDEGGYRRVVLTWFDVKTPDGRHWDKLSFPFYNYAPDFEIDWSGYYIVIEPRANYLNMGSPP